MEIENEELCRQLAERYRRQGYNVTVNPGPAVLPPFAKDYKVELLAERPDGNILVSAKPSAAEIERETSLADLADAVAKQPGWRFDITLFRPPELRSAPPRDAPEMTRRSVEQAIQTAAQLYDSGFEPQALLTAWSALESAMRHQLRRMGEKAGYGMPVRSMLNALISAGEIDQSEFRELEALSRVRNIIAHGFEPPPIGRGAVELLSVITHRLLNEAKTETSTS